MNGYVFIDGWGLVQFKCIEVIEIEDSAPVYRGKVKYPSGWLSPNYKRWDKYEFDFEADMIFDSVVSAAQHVINSQPTTNEYKIS